MILNIFRKFKSVLTFRRVIRLTCVFLILAALFLPWWRIHMKYGPLLEGGYNVFPHGIYGSFPEVSPFQWTETRTEALQLFTGIYLGCVALGVLGTVLKGRKGTILILVTGALLLTIAYMFHSRVVQTTKEFGYPAQGLIITAERDTYIIITMGFQSGFYLAAVAGLLCIVSIPLEYLYSKLRHRLRPKEASMERGKLTISEKPQK